MLLQIIIILSYTAIVALFISGFMYMIKDHSYNKLPHKEKATRGVS